MRSLILIIILIFSLIFGITLVQAALQITCNAGGPYLKNSVMIVIGNVTDTVGTTANVSVNITKDGSIKASRSTTSDSDGKYYVNFNEELSSGNYSVNASATKGGTFTSSNCSLEIKLTEAATSCLIKTMTINGTAVYSNTGQVISSGTVSASVMDTNFKNSASFTNGRFSVALNMCLFSGRRYTLAVFVDGGAERNSWSQIIFNVV